MSEMSLVKQQTSRIVLRESAAFRTNLQHLRDLKFRSALNLFNSCTFRIKITMSDDKIPF